MKFPVLCWNSSLDRGALPQWLPSQRTGSQTQLLQYELKKPVGQNLMIFFSLSLQRWESHHVSRRERSCCLWDSHFLMYSLSHLTPSGLSMSHILPNYSLFPVLMKYWIMQKFCFHSATDVWSSEGIAVLHIIHVYYTNSLRWIQIFLLIFGHQRSPEVCQLVFLLRWPLGVPVRVQNCFVPMNFNDFKEKSGPKPP